MISTKEDYLYYLEQDRIALGVSGYGFRNRLRNALFPNPIWRFQRIMRKLEYLTNVKGGGNFSDLVPLAISSSVDQVGFFDSDQYVRLGIVHCALRAYYRQFSLQNRKELPYSRLCEYRSQRGIDCRAPNRG